MKRIGTSRNLFVQFEGGVGLDLFPASHAVFIYGSKQPRVILDIPWAIPDPNWTDGDVKTEAVDGNKQGNALTRLYS